MQLDWSTLGTRAPTALVKARILAHHAVQWPARAARANLAALPDDSHSSLTWDSERGVLFSQALPADGADVRIGLRVAGPALIVMRGNLALDTYELAGRRESMVGVWLDSALRALGLQPASGVTLPYTIHFHPVARGSVYNFSGESDAFADLAQWLTAATDLLEGVRQGCSAANPGAVRCWPHHFDIAAVLTPGAAAGGQARSIGIGLSLGDQYYAQPYIYVSPQPHPDLSPLPELPPGHWHTHGFFGAVATGEQIFSLADRRAGAFAFVRSACEISGACWDAGAQDASKMHDHIPVNEQHATAPLVTDGS